MEAITAGVVLALCLFGLLRLLIGRSRRARLDAALRGRDGRWDGNVYAPKSFRKPRKPH
ncbi:hypothetical protein ABXN37_04860 [Piscinibacter sakaiensis]|uniref:hypothetical protein n=1 Tax=Piscinibacter sakaiensis TaxID=1547922 RepID=UPI00372659D4